MNSFYTKCQFLIYWSNKLLKRSQSSSRNAAYNANVGYNVQIVMYIIIIYFCILKIVIFIIGRRIYIFCRGRPMV